MVKAIGDFLSNIGSAIGSVKDFVTMFYDLFVTVTDFLPYPFNFILRAFIGIAIVILIIKLVGTII